MDIDVLGNRPQDLSKDWGSHVGTNLDWVDNKLWREIRLNHPLGFDVGDFPEGAENSLSDHQCLIYDMVMEHDHHIANGESPAPLRLNISDRLCPVPLAASAFALSLPASSELKRLALNSSWMQRLPHVLETDLLVHSSSSPVLGLFSWPTGRIQ